MIKPINFTQVTVLVAVASGMLAGCSVVSATAGAAISVAGAATSAAIKVTGSAASAAIDAMSSDEEEKASD